MAFIALTNYPLSLLLLLFLQQTPGIGAILLALFELRPASSRASSMMAPRFG